MKPVKGSFSVEASLIVPFVIFIIISVVYLFIYGHDCSVLQSFAFRSGERVLFAEGEEISSDEAAMIMMSIDDYKKDEDGSLIYKKLTGLLTSWKKEKITVSGHVSINVPGTATMTGGSLSANYKGTGLRVSYVDDWLKTNVLMQKE